MGLPNPSVFLLSDRQALHLQQEKMFNTKVFTALMTELELKKAQQYMCITWYWSLSLVILILTAFCISIFASLHSMAPRSQLSHATAVPKVWELIMHELWYLVWEWTGFELKEAMNKISVKVRLWKAFENQGQINGLSCSFFNFQMYLQLTLNYR